MIYRLYVFLHLVGVVVFFGGFAASLFAKARAERTRDPKIIGYTFSLINFNDKWFTPFSIVLILVGGFGAALMAGLPVVGTGWILWSLVLFGVSGLIFVFRALPLQHRIERMTGGGASSGDFDWSSYQELSRSWTRWATGAFLIVVGAFVLMVFKPALLVPCVHKTAPNRGGLPFRHLEVKPLRAVFLLIPRTRPLPLPLPQIGSGFTLQ